MKAITLSLCLSLAVMVSAHGEASDQQPDAQTPLTALPYLPSLDVQSMDPTADACVDFYQYACGGWMARNPIPADRASWSVYEKLTADNERFLWGILLSLSPGTPRSAPQQKIGDHFAACMDESAVDARGAKPLQPVLTAIDGIKRRGEVAAVLATMQLDIPNQYAFFGFGADQDLSDSAQQIAFVGAGGLGLPDRDYYTDADAKMQKLRASYIKHVTTVLELSGTQPAQAARDAASIMKLETELAKASLTRVERRDPYQLFHKLSDKQLRELTPSFDWDAYFALLQVPDTKTFNVTEPKFMKAFDQALRNTPLPVLKAYLRWHAIRAASPYLNSALVNARFDFYSKELRGVPTLAPRWKRCVNLVDEQLGDALGAEFVARAFSAELKASTLTLARQIESEMHDTIESLDWMSKPTKVKAQEKLAEIVNKIGYPDHWRDYSSIDIKADDFFANVVGANRFEVRRNLNKIGHPVDRTEWGMTPPTVNAYYSPQMNDINFPAGVLQPPLFDPKMDAAPNYGNTGGTVGHELTHGFDDEGRQFDAKGNLHDWWAESDAKEFADRAQCVVDQYAEYVVVDDIHINSRLTLGEDIADLGGLVLSYAAWRHSLGDLTPPAADGLTGEQRFFVGNAQWACENNRPEILRLHAKTDPHSPGRYRVNGLVPNMPEFAAAFGCKSGQPMVRDKRCRVW